MEEALKDERFSHILTDPRFRKMPRNVRKVTVDKRFKGMFKDKKFKGKCMFDKRGRPLDLASSENLKKLYEVSSESSENDQDEDDIKNKRKNKIKPRKPLPNRSSSKDSSGEESQEVANEQKESSSDDDSDEEVQGATENDRSPRETNLKVEQLKTVTSTTKWSAKQSKYKQTLRNQKYSLSSHDDSNEELSPKKENDKNIYLNNLKLKQLETVSPKKKDSISKHVQNKKVKESLIKQRESSTEESDSDEGALIIDESPVKENSKVKKLEKVFSNQNYLSPNSKQSKKVKGSVLIKSSDDENNSADAVDKDSSEESDDSDDSESDDSSGDISEEFDHQWEELRNEAPDTEEISHRIAVCNMDWDRIRAEDLYACFNSFKPADGCINSVKIYPSEYGLKRMEEENLHGPPELVEETLPLDEEEPEDKKGSRYHREKLRQYQINRLKYYYAVVDCDSSKTANVLYEQLNGMEYESSSVRLDLRFIPDDVTFDHEPTSFADKPPNPTEYQPRLFVTAALQQVKVNLTWDETDPKRRETLDKAFTEPDNIEKDIKDYLASSSGESGEEDKHSEEDADVKLNTKDRIAKYRELLLSLEEKEKEEENKYEMEITWEPGLKEKTEEIVKERMKKDHLNPFDEMVQKKQEERKLKRKEQKAMHRQENVDDESNDDDDEFFTRSASVASGKEQNAKRLAELALISDSKKETNFEERVGKKRWKSKLHKEKEKQKDTFKMDVNDLRFSAIYSSHLYNIDPSNPHYKDTEGNRALIQEKQKKLKSTEFYGRNKNPKKARHS